MHRDMCVQGLACNTRTRASLRPCAANAARRCHALQRGSGIAALGFRPCAAVCPRASVAAPRGRMRPCRLRATAMSHPRSRGLVFPPRYHPSPHKLPNRALWQGTRALPRSTWGPPCSPAHPQLPRHCHRSRLPATGSHPQLVSGHQQADGGTPGAPSPISGAVPSPAQPLLAAPSPAGRRGQLLVTQRTMREAPEAPRVAGLLQRKREESVTHGAAPRARPRAHAAPLARCTPPGTCSARPRAHTPRTQPCTGVGGHVRRMPSRAHSHTHTPPTVLLASWHTPGHPQDTHTATNTALLPTRSLPYSLSCAPTGARQPPHAAHAQG